MPQLLTRINSSNKTSHRKFMCLFQVQVPELERACSLTQYFSVDAYKVQAFIGELETSDCFITFQLLALCLR